MSHWRVEHISLRPAPPHLEPAPDNDADALDVAPEEPEGEEFEAFGTTIALPLWKPREQLLCEWAAIGDQATVDRGWGAIPTSPGEAIIEPRFIHRALDTNLARGRPGDGTS